MKPNPNTRRFDIRWGILPLALLLACATTGPGGRRSLILIPESDEIALGRGLAEHVDTTETILADEAWQAYITEVGDKIVAVSDRPNLDYQFRVIDSDQVNAFAAPGGFIYFYTGILRMMDSEAEMAAVMAHEISHVVGRHGVKHMQSAGLIGLGATLILGDGSDWLQAVNIFGGLWMTGYGRGHELEADEFGVHYMVKAGYNPEGARTMFTKLAELGGGGDRSFFENLASSHPETKERISKIDRQIAAMPSSALKLPYFEDRYQLLKNQLPEPRPDDGG